MTERIARISRPLNWRHDFIRTHDYRCHYCNRFAGSVDAGPDGKPWHVDHKDALANGGEDAEENLTLACERCNSFKRTLPYDNFRRYARSVLWANEPERLTLKDLEALEASYLRTTPGKWMTRNIEDPQTDYTTQVFAINEGEYDTTNFADEIAQFVTTGGRSGGDHNVHFLLEAERLMPKLIAEIHLLHAELAISRLERQDPAQETSVA